MMPNGWFSWGFTAFDDGTPVARINLAWLREGGELEVEGIS